jgi:hypothetical protein
MKNFRAATVNPKAQTLLSYILWLKRGNVLVNKVSEYNTRQCCRSE